MTLIKRTNGNHPAVRTFLSDFFDTDRFFGNSLFPTFEAEWIPAVNVIENEKDFSIEVAAPGFRKNDFEIVVENGILNISAEHKEETEEKEKNYTRREFSYNQFSRSFSLPENSSDENVTAKYDEGVLKLTLSKKTIEPAKRKKEVQVA
ncbi:MAG: Hsp20/alpha crystallin family protein [Bacteroidetes bacterium]|nr:Hsp20/alpha crystallin family protein [Bacteroidota bacterium]